MTKRQEQLAKAVFKSIFEEAKNLGLGELLILKTVYGKNLTFEQLTPDLKEKFLRVGVNVINTAAQSIG